MVPDAAVLLVPLAFPHVQGTVPAMSVRLLPQVDEQNRCTGCGQKVDPKGYGDCRCTRNGNSTP